MVIWRREGRGFCDGGENVEGITLMENKETLVHEFNIEFPLCVYQKSYHFTFKLGFQHIYKSL